MENAAANGDGAGTMGGGAGASGSRASAAASDAVAETGGGGAEEVPLRMGARIGVYGGGATGSGTLVMLTTGRRGAGKGTSIATDL